MVKTPQQIRNEVEKGIKRMEIKADEEANKCSCKDRFSHLPQGYLELKSQLSILTEYDKSIKEMIGSCKRYMPDGTYTGYMSEEEDGEYIELKELLSKIGDNSEVEK